MDNPSQRGSGLLLHISALPSPHGIGDLGDPAHAFIDFLAECDQQYWQFLPTGPTSSAFGNSPYMSLSAFAGNPLLINPEDLVDLGYLTPADLIPPESFSDYLVDFTRVILAKTELLTRAFTVFLKQQRQTPDPRFTSFCQKSAWLDDYALYMSLREENQQTAWNTWTAPLARHDRKALAMARKRLAERITYYQFEQFCFFSQWQRLKDHANQQGISLIGDLPFYLGFDSADVWANQELFRLDPETMSPTHVAGVPPDYFSETGQRWGNPIYCWQDEKGGLNRKLVQWWSQRFAHTFITQDIVRIDHFRGFEAYWEVPANEKYAINGTWITGPGLAFFEAINQELGDLAIIAEDLGLITPKVEELRDALGYPGMKVLQFAFDSDQDNAYLPHNFQTTNCVVYTGTHDNDTTLGWYLSAKASDQARRRFKKHANSTNESEIHWDMIRIALASTARLAITPLQDVLGYGGDCRMNTPATSEGNWCWRAAPGVLSQEIRDRLAEETRFYNRAPARREERTED